MSRRRQGTRLTDGSLSFEFDGRSFEAQPGDTAASALLAHGVRLLGRSVKTRRRRGVMTAGPEEPNALLTVGRGAEIIPNVPASQLILRNGMTLRSQNRWPSLRWDLASVLQMGGGLFGAGFYYKTFIWPSWRAYEPLIRRLAGLGPAPGVCCLPPVATEHLSCDVLIAGGGPAGLAAARAAARAGARTVLCEREAFLGGELEFEGGVIEGQSSAGWIQSTTAELTALGARILLSTALVGSQGGQYLAHAEPGGIPGANAIYRIRPRRVVLAMGSTERPIIFVNNDLPGVMLLSAAERLLARYEVAVGQRLVIFTNHNRAYSAAIRLNSRGMRVCALVDTRSERDWADATVARLRDHLLHSGTACLTEHAVVAATGRSSVTGAQIGGLAERTSTRTIACDTILTSGGWNPAMHAATQEGGVARYASAIAAFVPDQEPQWRTSVGAANGNFELSSACTHGAEAGMRAAAALGLKQDGESAQTTHDSARGTTDCPDAAGEPLDVARDSASATTDSGAGQSCAAARDSAHPTADFSNAAGGFIEATGDPAPALSPFWRAPASRSNEHRQYVDFQNDVTVADLRTAMEEGFSDIEHAKRYTALGFGTDQGRLAGVLGAAILGELQGKALEDMGCSRLRQPYHAVTMHSLAGFRKGASLRVERRTPLHAWHLDNGGVMEPAGLWQRPRFYRQNGAEAGVAAIAEARRVRSSGGIVDASTLGKIEIVGGDAAAFLDCMYLTRASSLKVGCSRYGINLREDGVVLDDGLILRLAPDRFRLTTSTGHAAHILSHFEFYHATEWGERALSVTDVTEAWSVIAAAGPRSREAVLRIIDVSGRAAVAGLRHMEHSKAHFRQIELRILRATFSGELGYEIHSPPQHALEIWQTLIDEGLAPYGLEALDILRIEKGYLTGAELNGQTTPYDLGLERLVQREGHFIGQAMLERPAFHESRRPRLVGLRAREPSGIFLAGAQLIAAQGVGPCGHITSSTFSPEFDEWIGLALVARSLPSGTELIAHDPVRRGDTPVRLTSTMHYDPTGKRMRG